MFILLMLISHTMSDFLLQSDSLVESKSNKNIIGFLLHGLIIVATSFPILVFVQKEFITDVFVSLISILALHVFIDIIKENISSLINADLSDSEFFKCISSYISIETVNLIIFIVDQLLHMLIIFRFSGSIVIEFNSSYDNLINKYFKGIFLDYNHLKNAFMILYISLSGSYFVRLALNAIYKNVKNYSDLINSFFKSSNLINDKNKNDSESSFEEEINQMFSNNVNVGKSIGILERILILMLIMTNNKGSIGFVITIKSLARFKMMDNKHFAEYYL